MLIAWMAYSAALSAMVAGCALALERVAEIWGLSRRWAWLAALVFAVLTPATLALRPVNQPTSVAAQSTSTDVHRQVFPVGATPMLMADRAPLHERFLIGASVPPSWNNFAGAAWSASSLVLAGLLVGGAISLSRKKSGWRETTIDGHTVLLAPDVGPAVVGVVRPRIVIPAWALALLGDERALVFEHEAEHVRGRDPMLIAAAAWAAAFLPWNPAIWFIVRRLRLAIEIDCDRRVLARREARVHEYGLLLLSVGARTASALRFSASLAEPRHFLEHRILAMTSSRPSRPILASVPFAAIAMFAAIAVAQTPRPESTLVARSATPAPARVPTRAPEATAPTAVEAPPRLDRRLEPFARRSSDQKRLSASPTIVPPSGPLEMLSVGEEPLGVDVIRGWIQLHHPNVIAGDPHVNSVVILVDVNNRYLASITDSVASQIVGTDSSLRNAFGISARRAAQLSSEPTQSPTTRPVFIVDGVRVAGIEQLDSIPIREVEVIKGPLAAAAYGPDAENGAVIVWTMRPSSEQLSRLGISAENIHEMTELHVRPGVVGPNRMFIAIIRLKDPRG
jgi:hypothetical protein